MSTRSEWLNALASLQPFSAELELPADQDDLHEWASAAGFPEAIQLQAFARVIAAEYREDLADANPLEEYLQRFDISFARHHGVLACEDSQAGTRVVIGKWSGWATVDTISRVLRRPVEPVFAAPHAVESLINRAYESRSGDAQQVISSFDQAALLQEIEALEGREDLLQRAGRAPVIQLVNSLLSDAVKAGASDVHLQPYEDRLVVRQRIDGVLFDYLELPKAVQEEVLSRMKVLGRMDIAEKRLPQDGRATVQLGDRLVDLRIASLPTSHSERLVIRILDKSAQLYTLSQVGMRDKTFDRFRQLIRLDHGLILVTGPTGSGKSTTLYAALQEINTTDQNVLTLEDPIEYQLDGVSQTQINEKKGMTFASGLRSVLRQDPDIIMVGEIRDQETAMMAIQASLTGHLVFSTLHTNDAASAVTRLLDLGIEPYLVASSLVAALAQRLVRRICVDCRAIDREAPRPEEFFERYPQHRASPLYTGKGCPSCRATGYRGRVGLFELLVLDERCRQLVQDRANATEIRDAALAADMVLLRDDGFLRALEGLTSAEEVARVAGKAVLDGDLPEAMELP